MDMDQVAGGLVLVVIHVIAAVGWWIRLRWRLRHEKVRARMLVDLATRLSEGGGGELDDGRTRLSVSPARKRQGSHG
jgi:hypothetical protein